MIIKDVDWSNLDAASIRRLIAESNAESEGWWEGACLAVVKGFAASGDWIISRQSCWGLPLPAFHCQQCRRATIAAAARSRCVMPRGVRHRASAPII